MTYEVLSGGPIASCSYLLSDPKGFCIFSLPPKLLSGLAPFYNDCPEIVYLFPLTSGPSVATHTPSPSYKPSQLLVLVVGIGCLNNQPGCRRIEEDHGEFHPRP